MLMPMGKFEGQPVESMSTTYLMWLVSNDALRFKRWPLIEEALRVLRGRFESFDGLLADLRVDTQPPAHWKTPERTAEQKETKAEKLRQLEQRRQEERLAGRSRCLRQLWLFFKNVTARRGARVAFGDRYSHSTTTDATNHARPDQP